MNDWIVDKSANASYYKLSDRPVAYSIEVAPLVVADYDERGNVAGIELLTAATEKYDIHNLIALAGKVPLEMRSPA
jgi:uncharacterized protein YuzE